MHRSSAAIHGEMNEKEKEEHCVGDTLDGWWDEEGNKAVLYFKSKRGAEVCQTVKVNAVNSEFGSKRRAPRLNAFQGNVQCGHEIGRRHSRVAGNAVGEEGTLADG